MEELRKSAKKWQITAMSSFLWNTVYQMEDILVNAFQTESFNWPVDAVSLDVDCFVAAQRNKVGSQVSIPWQWKAKIASVTTTV